MNCHDLAGSTVVHSIGGWIAIAGAIMLGPRLGRKFKRDGGGPMLPHDLTINGGRVAMNTTLAACTGVSGGGVPRPCRPCPASVRSGMVPYGGSLQSLAMGPGSRR